MVLANIAGTASPTRCSRRSGRRSTGAPCRCWCIPPTCPASIRWTCSKYDLSWSVGFIADTTLAFTRIIFDGFLDLYPNLKLIASHGGGALPYLVGRFDKGDEVEIPSRRRIKARPSEYLKRIWYDCITYNPAALRFLIRVVGADRVMFGTDYPHQVHDMKGSMANTGPLPPETVPRHSGRQRAGDVPALNRDRVTARTLVAKLPAQGCC